MQFDPIQLPRERETVLTFRKDSFAVSFGTTENFGSEDKYLNWLENNIARFPKGFVLVRDSGKPIGQMELAIREYEGNAVGYVHLYYLVLEKRGMGIGSRLDDYARDFFREKGMSEFHLRVSPTNHQAMAFYQKNEMQTVGPEMDGKVIRMKGDL